MPHVPILGILGCSNLELSGSLENVKSIRQLMSILCLETGQPWTYVIGDSDQFEDEQNTLFIKLVKEGDEWNQSDSDGRKIIALRVKG